MDESCIEHSPEEPAELLWATELRPSADGRFWCVTGRHYVVVERELLWAAIVLLTFYPEAVAV